MYIFFIIIYHKVDKIQKTRILKNMKTQTGAILLVFTDFFFLTMTCYFYIYISSYFYINMMYVYKKGWYFIKLYLHVHKSYVKSTAPVHIRITRYLMIITGINISNVEPTGVTVK